MIEACRYSHRTPWLLRRQSEAAHVLDSRPLATPNPRHPPEPDPHAVFRRLALLQGREVQVDRPLYEVTDATDSTLVAGVQEEAGVGVQHIEIEVSVAAEAESLQCLKAQRYVA